MMVTKEDVHDRQTSNFRALRFVLYDSDCIHTVSPLAFPECFEGRRKC